MTKVTQLLKYLFVLSVASGASSSPVCDAPAPHQLTTCPQTGPAARCRPCVFNADKARNLLSCHDTHRFGLDTTHLEKIRHAQQLLCKSLNTNKEHDKHNEDPKWWDQQTTAMYDDNSYLKICRGNITEFREVLDVYLTTKIVFGFSWFHATDDPDCLQNGVSVSDDGVFYIFDSFMRLLESTGVRHVYSPEHHGYGWNACQDIRSQMAQLQTILGINLTAPAIGGGTIGLNFEDMGVIGPRHFSGIYIAWKLSHILSGIGGGNVCEIGGGMGYVAYYSKLLDLEAASSYTLIDIDAGLLSQHLLLKAPFGDSVRLYEGSQTSFLRGTITLVPTLQFPDFDFNGCDIVVNVDSFPEMGSDAVESYFTRINASSTVRFLFSQNQESRISDAWSLPQGGSGRQGCVKDLAEKFGFKTVSRQLAWMRMGYVEELFVVGKQSSGNVLQHTLRSGIQASFYVDKSTSPDVFFRLTTFSTATTLFLFAYFLLAIIRRQQSIFRTRA